MSLGPSNCPMIPFLNHCQLFRGVLVGGLDDDDGGLSVVGVQVGDTLRNVGRKGWMSLPGFFGQVRFFAGPGA